MAKRTVGLADPKDAERVAAATRKDYPRGISRFGADALRFTLAAMAAQVRAIQLSVSRVAGSRPFATKLWTASRFAELNGCVSTGKEANVYQAATAEGVDLAVKVYKTSILTFKDRDRCACTPAPSPLLWTSVFPTEQGMRVPV